MSSNSELQIVTHWFPRRYEVDFHLRAPLSPNKLSLLVDSTIFFLCPPASFQGKEFINCKGREHPSGGEIIWARGRSHSEGSLETAEPESFTVRLLSKFKEFRGLKDIVYTPETEVLGSLPPHFPADTLGRAFPIRLEEFRFGLEFFKPSFATASFGLAPAVTEGIWITSDQKLCELRLFSEKLSSKNILPLQENAIFSAVVEICTEVLGVDLVREYQEQMRLK